MKQSGFTLLEAIVALVLISTTSMALLNLINNDLFSLQRVRQVYERNQAIHNALAFIETVNPLAQPQGKQLVGMYQISWRTVAIELPKDGLESAEQLSLYQVGLYNIQVELYLPDKPELFAQFSVDQVGYKQIRFPKEDDW